MNQLKVLLESELCANLLSALLHSLWQAIIIAGLLLLYLRSKTAQRANSRYTASIIALIAIVICLLFTWSILNYEPAATLETTVATESSGQKITPADRSENILSGAGPKEVEIVSANSAGFNWKSWIMCLWLTGVVIMLFRTIYIIVGGAKLKFQCTVLKDEYILELVEQLRKSMRITRRIRIAVSEHILVPGVVGFIRPMLLLPVSMVSGVPTDTMQAILAHELAHIQRYDYLVNFCQMVIEAILFFNPALWWISRQIRIEREACCDNTGVATIGQRIRYAEVLAGWAQKIKEQNAGFANPAIGFGKQNDNGSMLERIRRILVAEHRPNLKVSWRIAAITLLLSFVTLAGLWQGTNMTVALAGKLSSDQSRTIHFPKERSIGEIFVRDKDIFAENYYAGINWECLAYAQGDITIHAGKVVRLDITEEAWQDGTLFAGLRPDDIQMLSFDKYQDANDAVLEDVSNLTNLQVLDLSGTRILGTGLKHLKKLKQLKWISFAGTHVEDEELAALAGLNALEYLNFNNVPIGNEGMIHIGKIKTLKAVVLSGTSVDDEGLEHIKDSTSLRQLSFFRNPITDEGLKYLAGLTEMEQLDLTWTKISNAGLVHLKGLKKLKELRLGLTKVGNQGLEHLKDLESLEYLDLPSDTEISDEGVAYLSGLDSLKKLCLISNAITVEGIETLAQLKSLEEFDMGGTNIDDVSIAKIAEFPALKSLWLQHCQVTDKGLSELKKLHSLTTLRIGNSPITGEGLTILRVFPSLAELELSYLYLGDARLSGLTGLTSLESLKIYNTGIKDDDLANLSGLTNLKTLYIDSKEITDVGLRHLANLKSLESLMLYGSEITNAGLVHLREHRSLTYLGLPGTKVTEEGMERLKKTIPALQYQL